VGVWPGASGLSVRVDFSKNFKLRIQPLGRLYYVAALLTNVKTCLMAVHPL
jgi:hypothetical protein